MKETGEQGNIENADQPKEEKLFTQEEVNSFFNKRYSTMMSQLEEYKAKAEKFDEVEATSQSELKKANERADALQNELDSIKKSNEIREIREKVAKESNIPADLLHGEDEETCKAEAEKLVEFARPKGYPTIKDGGEVIAPAVKQTTRDQFANVMKEILN